MDLVSDKPFWPIKSGLIRSYPSLVCDIKCDVVVLGAGISGALAAYHLVRAGMCVVVLDKRDVASGSTSASTAMLQYEIDTPLSELIERHGKDDAMRAYQVCLESIGKIERLCSDIGDTCGFTAKQSVYLAVKEKELKELEIEMRLRQEAGIAVDWMSKQDIETRFSFSRPGALLSQTAAEVDAYRLTHALLDKCDRAGARIFDRTHVTDYKPADDRVTVLTESGNTVRAKWAVFSTGYETVKILNRNVVDLNSSFAVVSEPMDDFTGWWAKCLIWETARPYLYMRTTDDGRAIVGGEDQSYRNPLRRDAAVARKAAKLTTRFVEMFPQIAFEPAYAWAGTFGETKDGLAYIGSVPELPRCIFTLGFGGNGITYSMIAAEIISETIRGRIHPDAHLFRFDR